MTLSQQTYVPDDNFEQELINLGYDIAPLDNWVYNSMINTVTSLNLSGLNIADLTGIFGFSALTELYCHSNQLTTLDVSNNTALTYLGCSSNQLTTLDLSQNTALTYLYCEYNQLTSLDVRNGNNSNIYPFASANNPLLYCIDVDDAAWSTANWTNIDPHHYFSENCP